MNDLQGSSHHDRWSRSEEEADERPWISEFLPAIVRGPDGEAIFTRDPSWYAVRFAWPLRNSFFRVLSLVRQEYREYTYLAHQQRPRGRRRPKPVLRSWIPGYVFLRLDLHCDRWQQLYAAPGFLEFLGSPTAVSAQDITSLDRLLPKHLRPRDPGLRFAPGEMVRINDGPFASHNGSIVSIDHKHAVLIGMVFGRPIKMTLLVTDIEKIV